MVWGRGWEKDWDEVSEDIGTGGGGGRKGRKFRASSSMFMYVSRLGVWVGQTSFLLEWNDQE